MGLEAFNLEKFDKQDEIKEVINTGKAEADDLFVKSLKSMNENQFVNFVEKTFKNESGEWQNYSQMRDPNKNPYYGFMVQAAIDMLSDNLKAYGEEKKFDKDGKYDDENGKTLDEWIKDAGGIDNNYGPKTRDIVKLVQKILTINVDGSAGPQFFAKICSILEGKTEIDDFRVQGYNNDTNRYRYNFDENNKGNESALDTYLWEGETITLDPGITFEQPRNDGNGGAYMNIRYNGKYLKQWLHKKKDGAITVEKHTSEYNEQEHGSFSIKETGSGRFRLSYKKPSTHDGNPGDQVVVPVEQNESEETEIRNLLDKMPYKSHFRFALKDNTGKFSYYSINPDGLYQYQYNEDTDNFKSSVEFNDYINSDCFKALTNEHLKGVDSGAYEIKNATYNDVMNAINGIDIEHPEKLDDDQLALIGEKIPRPGRWAYSSRVKLGKWCLISSNGTGGKDFITRCEKMGPTKGGLPEEQLTVKNWCIFEGYLKKKMNTVDKIYCA